MNLLLWYGTAEFNAADCEGKPKTTWTIPHLNYKVFCKKTPVLRSLYRITQQCCACNLALAR
jgi:hypothetical protein